MSEKEFPEGLAAFKPHDNAPDFVIADLSVTRKDLGNWLRGKTEDKIRLQVLESKKGTYYVAVNDYKPKEPDQQKPDGFDDDIPFIFSGISLLGALSYSNEIQSMLQMSSGIIS